MSHPVYYVEEGDTLPIFFDSFDGGTGASITLTGLAVTDIEIYRDGSTTQRASDAGFTLLDTDGIDFDGVTGIHGFSLDLSDNTDSGFYVVGSWYHVVVSSVTIDAQTVNFIAAAFRIVSATRGMAGTALPNAAADAAGGLPISDAGGLDLDAQVGTKINDILTDTGTTLDGKLNTAQADLDILTGTDGVTLATSQPNYAPGTAAELAKVPKSDSNVTWNATAAAQIQSEANDALVANHLDHLLAATYDPASKPGAADALLNELVESDAGVSRFTANALEEAPTGGSAPTAGEIADAVWDEAQGDHVTSGTFGEIATEIASILDDTDLIDDGTSGLAKIATDVAAILVDTAVIGATGEGLTTLATAAALQTVDNEIATIDGNVDLILEDTGTTLPSTLSTIAGYLDTEIAAILADTNELQTDWTDGGRLDLLVDAIKVITDALGATGAARLALSAGTMLPGTIDTTAFSSTTTEFEADDITEATADHFNGRIVIFTSGVLQYQATDITDYAIASGRGHFTVTALTEAPGNNDTFIIV